MIPKSTNTSKTERQSKMAKVFTHSFSMVARDEKFALMDLPHAANFAMKKVTAQAQTSPMRIQLMMLKALPRSTRLYRAKKESLIIMSVGICIRSKGNSSYRGLSYQYTTKRSFREAPHLPLAKCLFRAHDN